MTTLSQEASRRNHSRGTSDEVDPIIIAEWPIKRGEKRPGKGIAMGVKNLPQIAAAMEEALATARQRGLIPADRDGGQ